MIRPAMILGSMPWGFGGGFFLGADVLSFFFFLRFFFGSLG